MPRAKSPSCRMFLFCLLSLIFVSYAYPVMAEEGGVVVWRLESKEGVSEKNIDLISGFLTAEVERLSGRKVISEADIRTILRGEETRQQCGTGDTSCLAEVGNALGVPEAVSGELGRLGRLWVLNLRRINVRNAEVLKRVSRRVDGSIEDLVDALPGCVSELFGNRVSKSLEVQAREELPGNLAVRTIPEGAAICIDGEESGISPVTKSLSPGEYKVEAILDGYEKGRANSFVESGKTIELELLLEKSYPMNPYKIAAHASFWPGLAVAAFAGVSTWQAKQAADDYKGGDWAAKDRNQLWSGLATTGYVLGTAAMVAGVVLWAIAPSDKEWAESHQPSLSFTVTPDGKGRMVSIGAKF